MPAIVRNNLVTFRPAGGARVLLSLEGEFTLTAGVEPNVNRAVLLHDGYALLGGAVGVPGRLEFWYGASPLPEADGGNGPGAAPDRYMDGIRIVEVEPLRIGVLAGETEERVVAWRVALADVRERFAPPLGGLLMRGLVNPDATEAGAAAAGEASCAVLMQWCLDALGVAYGPLPAGLSDVTPPRNLKWFGVPAREELAALLEHTGCVLVPRANGTVEVRKVGATTGDDLPPNAPGDRKEVDLIVPSTDRRGTTVVFTSAPNPVLDTIKLKGPASDTWQYVVRDVDGAWKPLDDASVVTNYWTGSTAAEQIRKRFSGVGATHRDRVRAEAYRSIRLDPATYLPAIRGVLRRQVKLGDAARLVLNGIEVKTKRAQRQPDTGLWKNSTELIPCAATTLERAANVIRTWDLLGKVEGDGSVSDLEASFVPLAAGELEVSLTVEAARDGKPEYANFGFTRLADGTVQAMDEAQSRAAIENPGGDVVAFSRPELRLVRDAIAQTDNRTALQNEALILAVEHFRGANSLRVLTVKGFWPGELSGRVTEVRISQAAPRTTFLIDRTSSTLGGRVKPSALRRGDGPGRNRGGAAGGQSQSSQLALGGSAGGTQPIVPVEPYVPPPEPEQQPIRVAIGTGGTVAKPTVAIARRLDGAPAGQEMIAIECAVGHGGGEGDFTYACRPLGGTGSTYAPPEGQDPPPGVKPGAVVWREVGAPGTTFRVALSKDGGEAGSLTAQCSYTYTLKIGATTLGEKRSPQWGRPSLGKMTLGEVGLAFFDKSGQIVLMQANEHPFKRARCPTGE